MLPYYQNLFLSMEQYSNLFSYISRKFGFYLFMVVDEKRFPTTMLVEYGIILI
jgi:hypothetical protein